MAPTAIFCIMQTFAEFFSINQTHRSTEEFFFLTIVVEVKIQFTSRNKEKQESNSREASENSDSKRVIFHKDMLSTVTVLNIRLIQSNAYHQHTTNHHPFYQNGKAFQK